MADVIPLYRFLDSDAALKTLVAKKFRVGRPSKFNDPFEWRLGFSGISTPEERKRSEEFPSRHLTWLESWAGILCFSDSASKSVLWSLYAGEHRGVAFELKHPWPDDHLHKIRYSDERPVLDFDQLRKIPDGPQRDECLKRLILGLMYQKSLGWSFESEYRVFIDVKDSKCCQLADDRHHWQIPDNSLKRVILGFRCPLEEAVVRKLLDMNGLINTQVVRAKMCSETYAIIV